MNNRPNAFTLDTTIPEEALIDLAGVVDQLDSYRMVIDGELTEPETDRTLITYIERATLYLEYLNDLIEEDDIMWDSTPPLTETLTRRRITQLLRRGFPGKALS